MVTENYVSFQTANRLKNRGFYSEECFAFYKENGEIGFLQTFGDITDFYSETCVIAPTLQMAMKWLFEEKNCIVIPIPRMFNADGVCDEWGFSLWVDDNLEVDGEKIWRNDVYGTREEAENAGIEYCLENIIL